MEREGLEVRGERVGVRGRGIYGFRIKDEGIGLAKGTKEGLSDRV